MSKIKSYPLIAAFVLGALCVFGFSPYNLFIAPIVGLAGLFYFWQISHTPKQAAKVGFSFGLGFFIAGIYWIYISLHDVGGMPFWMAGIATLGLCAFLALFPALVGFLAKRSHRLLMTAAIVWVLAEWVRSWIFTGFPWLSIGYSQVPFSPLAGYAPVFGAFGVSAACAISASLLASIYLNHQRQRAILALSGIWLIGALISLIPWTTPAGKPLNVTLLQGNIAQELKWDEAIAFQTINQYLSMAKQAKGELVILPETALPISVDTQLQDASQDQVLSAFNTVAQEQHKAILLGLVAKDKEAYFNSVLGFNSVDNRPQFYHKYHLVPFGEFIPLKAVFGWVYRDWLNMPLSDLSRGEKYQQPIQLANQKIAVNICYEDVFGEEIIRQLPQATLLVNVSNDAWYGRSNAADQHMQFSQMRALETGRTMLRATNTGSTTIISPQGMILALLQQFETAILNGSAQGYVGATPFVRWGNWPTISLLLIALILLWGRKKK